VADVGLGYGGEANSDVVANSLKSSPPQQEDRKDLSAAKKLKDVGAAKPTGLDKFLAPKNEPVTAEALRRAKSPVQQYLDPNGYWENTYTPGSPLLQQLVQQLRSELPSTIAAESLTATDQGLLTEHPMDAPVDGALGLATFLDTVALPRAGRVFMQVSIKGAIRPTGTRPPLTLAVTLPDTRGISSQDWERIQELLLAVESERRVDDHIYVVTDTNVLEANSFRLGTLSVFLKEARSKEQRNNRATFRRPDHISNAFSRAVSTVLEGDPTSLNERVVLTVAHSSLSADTLDEPTLQQLVNQGGVGSVIALSDSIELKQKAAIGQGSYRLLHPSVDPAQLMREEFLSYGAVVARALRLNVQLSPGVKLIDVIGSRKLSQKESQRDKVIERSIDKRLSASLGIAEDRGEDDPGIQILIPRFLAEDNHAILFELFVPQSGPIADVSLRSKDLVLLKNQTLRASASLPAFGETASDTHRAVSMNVYAQRFAGTLRAVRDLVANGQLDQARVALRNFSNELRANMPQSPRRDATMTLLSRYDSVLAAAQSTQQNNRSTGALVTTLSVAEEQVRKIHPTKRSP
jgi:Ca-activated chloride channel family protein